MNVALLKRFSQENTLRKNCNVVFFYTWGTHGVQCLYRKRIWRPALFSTLISYFFRNDFSSSISPMSVGSLETLSWVTPRLVGSLSNLVNNLLCVSPEVVLKEVKDEDILGSFTG